MPLKTAFLSLAFMSLTASVMAQGLTGDPAAGKEVSVKWCASCHAVTPDQKTIQSGVISFARIANLKDVSMSSLIAIQTMPHQPMLDLDLSRQIKRDIAAYILSLKSK